MRPSDLDGGHREPATRGAAPRSPAAALAYPLTALVRADDAGASSTLVTRDLVRVTAELAMDSAIALELATGDEPGKLVGHLEVHGSAATELDVDELRSMLERAVVLGDPVPIVTSMPVVDSAFEMTNPAVAPMFRPTPPEVGHVPEWSSREQPLDEGPGFATPLPDTSDSAERLLEALARARRTVRVRTVLAPVDELEARLVIDELNASIGRRQLSAYAGTPVCARTVVVALGPVPPAVRARLRQRSVELIVAPVSVGSVTDLWLDPVRAVRGAAVGELHAVALTRVPTGGTVAALGVPTVRPAPRVRPLDPLPSAPASAIRLGWARDAYGTKADVRVAAEGLRRPTYVEAAPGWGKSSTELAIIRSAMHAGHPVIFFDPHGSAATAAAAYSTEVDSQTLFVRHGDREHPIGLNPLAGKDEEAQERNLTAVLDLLQDIVDPGKDGYFGERAKRSIALISQCAHVVFGSAATLHTVVALALDRGNLRLLAKAVRDSAPDLARRLEAELTNLGDKEYTDLVSWLVSRMQPFLRTGALRSILGSGVDAIDLTDLIDRGTNLIVDLSAMTLGEDVARLLGSVWLLKVLEAMGHRRDPGREVFVVVDEAWLYPHVLPSLLPQARKTGICLVLASQSADTMPPRLTRAVEANSGTWVCGRLGIRTAPSASDRLGGWPAAELTRLPDLSAAASFSFQGVPTPPFTLHIDHWERVADAGWTTARTEHVADEVAEATQVLLGPAVRDVSIPTDDEILSVLRAVAAGRLGAPVARELVTRWAEGAEPSNTRRPAAAPKSLDAILDRWSAQRSATAGDGLPEAHFDVVLDDCGPHLRDVAREIRELAALGLAESTALAGATGARVLRRVEFQAAERAHNRLATAGAVVRVVRHRPVAG